MMNIRFIWTNHNDYSGSLKNLQLFTKNISYNLGQLIFCCPIESILFFSLITNKNTFAQQKNIYLEFMYLEKDTNDSL